MGRDLPFSAFPPCYCSQIQLPSHFPRLHSGGWRTQANRHQWRSRQASQSLLLLLLCSRWSLPSGFQTTFCHLNSAGVCMCATSAVNFLGVWHPRISCFKNDFLQGQGLLQVCRTVNSNDGWRHYPVVPISTGVSPWLLDIQEQRANVRCCFRPV